MLILFYVDQKENHLGSLFCLACASQIFRERLLSARTPCGLSAYAQCWCQSIAETPLYKLRSVILPSIEKVRLFRSQAHACSNQPDALQIQHYRSLTSTRFRVASNIWESKVSRIIVRMSNGQRVNWPVSVVMVLFHLGAIAALFMFNWQVFAAAVVLYWLATGLGISMGYHRLLTHRSYKVPLLLEYFFAVLGTLTLEGGPISWVATHRIHHQKSDRDGDPHSPLVGRAPHLRRRLA
jgi:hypothetical protein